MMLALDGTGSGGTALVVPAGSRGRRRRRPATRLADAYATGGLAAEQLAVEGVFGITTAASDEVDEAGLVALLQPYTPIHVTLDSRAVAPRGGRSSSYPGRAPSITADQAAQLSWPAGPKESEINRLEIRSRSGRGFAGRQSSAASPTNSAPTDVARSPPSLAAGADSARALDVPLLDAVANPQGLDLLQVDDAALRLLLAQIIPTAIRPPTTTSGCSS